MLTQQQVAWKNEVNAQAWCNLKGYKFLHIGAFDVFYQKPEQVGVIVKTALGMELSKRNWYEAYSSINWLDVFTDLDAAEHQMQRMIGTHSLKQSCQTMSWIPITSFGQTCSPITANLNR